eukprot:gene11665-biopygen11556
MSSGTLSLTPPRFFQLPPPPTHRPEFAFCARRQGVRSRDFYRWGSEQCGRAAAIHRLHSTSRCKGTAQGGDGQRLLRVIGLQCSKTPTELCGSGLGWGFWAGCGSCPGWCLGCVPALRAVLSGLAYPCAPVVQCRPADCLLTTDGYQWHGMLQRAVRFLPPKPSVFGRDERDARPLLRRRGTRLGAGFGAGPTADVHPRLRSVVLRARRPPPPLRHPPIRSVERLSRKPDEKRGPGAARTNWRGPGKRPQVRKSPGRVRGGGLKGKWEDTGKSVMKSGMKSEKVREDPEESGKCPGKSGESLGRFREESGKNCVLRGARRMSAVWQVAAPGGWPHPLRARPRPLRSWPHLLRGRVKHLHCRKKEGKRKEEEEEGKKKEE